MPDPATFHPAILALLYKGTILAPTSDDHLRMMEHVHRLVDLAHGPVHATLAGLVVCAHPTPDGTVVLVYRKGDDFAKSARRWCQRFAKEQATRSGVQKGRITSSRASNQNVPRNPEPQSSGGVTEF